MWEGMDKRKFPRANYRCTLHIKSKEDKASGTIATHTENIGLGGTCVTLKDKIELFKRVDLEVSLEDGTPPIKCEGSIMWAVKRTEHSKAVSYDIGIEFIDLKDADRERISAIVKKLLLPGRTP